LGCPIARQIAATIISELATTRTSTRFSAAGGMHRQFAVEKFMSVQLVRDALATLGVSDRVARAGFLTIWRTICGSAPGGLAWALLATRAA
jgi:hypothetical protein